jgi:hypothetical protein
VRQQPQAIIEPRCEAPDPKGMDAGCSELDRERNSIQPLADCSDNRASASLTSNSAEVAAARSSNS